MQSNDILKELDNISIEEQKEDNFDFESILKQLDSIDTNSKDTNNSKLFSWFVFFIKYISTSVFIFAILLVTTNYSAYYQIIKNYINHEQLQVEGKWIISSVEASNIKEKFKEQLDEEKQLIENEYEEKTSDYSVRKLINTSNKNDISLNIEITPYENRIVIPKIWKNIPLIDIENKEIEWEDELNNIFMKELENWVIRYPWSSTPWEDWTTFIFWHSSNFPWIKWDYNDVFALLDNVEYEDEIIIYYNQKKYIYKIREKK